MDVPKNRSEKKMQLKKQKFVQVNSMLILKLLATTVVYTFRNMNYYLVIFCHVDGQTKGKWCIGAHRATCRGGLKN